MANEREARLTLRIEADKNSLTKAQRDLEALEKAFESIPASVKRANQDVAQLTRNLIDQQRANLQNAQGMGANSEAARRLSSDIGRTGDNLRGMVEGLQESAQTAGLLAEKADEATASIQKLNVATAASADTLLGGGRREAFRAFQQENRIQSFAVRNVAGMLPGGGGEFGQLATGAFDLLDTLPKLSLSFDVLKRSVIDNIQAIGVGNIGMVGAIAALGVVIKLFQDQAEAARQSALGQLEAYNQSARLVATSNTDEIKRRRDEAEALVRISEEQARAAQEFQANLKKGIEQAFGGGGLLIAEFNARIGTNNTELVAAQQNVEATASALEKARVELMVYESAVNSSAFALKQAEEAEAELAETRRRAYEVIAQLQQQRTQLEYDAEERALEAGFDRALRQRRQAEDLARALEQQREAHNARLEAIEIAGQDRIEAIRESGIKRLAQFDEATSKLQGRLSDQIKSDNDKLRKLNADYMRDEVKATQKARDDELKRGRDHNKNLARLYEDRFNSELDAQEANDVLAMIQAERRSETQIKRAQEDFDDETKDRAERFLAERREAQERYQERLAEIQAESQARQQAIQDELAARKDARREIESEIAAAAEAEKARIKAQQDAQQAAFDDQLARDEETRRIQRERAEQDERIRQQREQDALNKQLRAIDTRIAMEADAAKLIVDFGQHGARILGESHITMATQVASAMTTLAQQAQQAIASGAVLPFNQAGKINWNLPTASFRGGGGGGMIAFAGGGIADRPTFGMFGERPGYAEAFIPFRKSEGLESALAKLGIGGPSVNFNAPITVGDGVSQQEVKAAMTEAVMGLLDGLATARGVA